MKITDEHYDNNNIHAKSDLEERINLFAGTDLLFDEDKALEELIGGYHPKITEKEMAICKTTTNALWDIGTPFYEAIIDCVLRTYKKLFTNWEDVENTIEQMIKKGIVKRELRFMQAGGGCHCNSVFCDKKWIWPRRWLMLNEDIETQSQMITSQMFESTMIKAFGAVKREEE